MKKRLFCLILSQGFLCLRVLLPVLAMGLCLLRAIKEQKTGGDK